MFIKHANSIQTKYLHFTGMAVEKGQRLSQGQGVGYVGSTGLATGPHLHYEFVVNGVHRNPRTVSLPKVEPLKDATLQTFRPHAAHMLTLLISLLPLPRAERIPPSRDTTKQSGSFVVRQSRLDALSDSV